MNSYVAKRFLYRKEDWGYLLQDVYHDRLWAADEASFAKVRNGDEKLPIWSEKPYQHTETFELGKLPEEKVLSAPLSISWSLTSQCNARCRFCCTDSINQAGAGEKEAGIKTIERMIDCLDQWQVLRMIIGGGEPLLRQDIEEILTLFQEKNIRPVIATNGLLLKNRLLRKVADSCMNIQISLDTLMPEKYRMIRGVDGLKSVLKHIEAAAETGVLVRIVTVLIRENLEELPVIADYLNRLGIRQWFIFDLLPSGRGASCYEKWHVSEQKAVQTMICQLTAMYPDMSIWYWGNQKADSFSVYVLPDGTLNLVDYQTDSLKRFEAKSSDDQDIVEAWTGIPVKERQQMLDNFLSANRMITWEGEK